MQPFKIMSRHTTVVAIALAASACGEGPAWMAAPSATVEVMGREWTSRVRTTDTPGVYIMQSLPILCFISCGDPIVEKQAYETATRLALERYCVNKGTLKVLDQTRPPGIIYVHFKCEA